MAKQEEKDLPAQELPPTVERWLVLFYYGSSIPYIMVADTRDDAARFNKEGNSIYKITLPTKKHE